MADQKQPIPAGLFHIDVFLKGKKKEEEKISEKLINVVFASKKN